MVVNDKKVYQKMLSIKQKLVNYRKKYHKMRKNVLL